MPSSNWMSKAGLVRIVALALCMSLVAPVVLSVPFGSALAASLGGGEVLPAPARPFPSIKSHDGRYEVALGFFERLFRRRKKSDDKDKQPVKKASRPKAPSAPVIHTIKKDPDAAVIAVFGDEFSQDIAWGLKDAFSQVKDVKVDIRSSARTGLVYRASKSPLHDLKAQFEKHPFTFAVVMVGLNDRVTIPAKKSASGEVVFPAYEFKSQGWQQSYGREIDRLREAFAELDKPVYWVGLPPVANKKLSDDMLFFNDFISSRLTERGERFIDIWDAFATEDGAFTSRGPDLSGEEQRLRQKNGIRFNKAGRRKLAFFVEKLVIRALSQSVDENVLPDNLASADETALREGRGASRNIYALRKPPLDSDKLINPASFLAITRERPSPRRQGSNAPELRVDDFTWKGSQ